MSGSSRLESLVHRKDETSSNIENPHGVPITLLTNRDVPVELEAVEQALAFVSCSDSGIRTGIPGIPFANVPATSVPQTTNSRAPHERRAVAFFS